MRKHEPVITRSKLKDYEKLSRRKWREETGLFLVEGVRSVESAVKAGAELEAILVTHEARSSERVSNILAATEATVYETSARELAKLTDVRTDQGIVAVAKRIVSDSLESVADVESFLLLNAVQDPGNVGTLIRTAAWFGVDAVVSDNETADFESAKVVRGAMGGLWDVRLVRVPSLLDVIDQLEAIDVRVHGAALSGQSISDWRPARRGALLLGSEARGLSG
ncbi:MAG: RNA methyltransferase, partial [Rubricoccaceae bacterium]|nr:RNA methyltransferase [Rubricoccaceae bacterium]